MNREAGSVLAARLWMALLVPLHLLSNSAASSDYNLTLRDAAYLEAAIAKLIKTELGPAEGFGSYHVHLAGFIRLAFHACVGGKCQGCINVNDYDQIGLDLHIRALENVRTQFLSLGGGRDISRADLWILAARIAFYMGMRITPFGTFPSGADSSLPNITSLYGRDDCSTAPYTDADHWLPDRRWGTEQVLDWFARTLGCSEFEAVALLGAHGLGVVRDIGTSAVIAQWTNTPDWVTNSLYKALINPDITWEQVAVNYTNLTHPLWSWRHADGQRAIMLNVDVALVRRFTSLDPLTGEVGCSFAGCPLSRTYNIVRNFAAKKGWREAFVAAFNKVASRGYTNLRPPTSAG